MWLRSYLIDRTIICTGLTKIYKWVYSNKKYVSLYRPLAKGVYTILTKVLTHLDYKVIKIHDKAFRYHKDLTEVIIPYGIQFIGEAFLNCPSLEKVVISCDVKLIGENAFKGCSVKRSNI